MSTMSAEKQFVGTQAAECLHEIRLEPRLALQPEHPSARLARSAGAAQPVAADQIFPANRHDAGVPALILRASMSQISSSGTPEIAVFEIRKSVSRKKSDVIDLKGLSSRVACKCVA